MEFQMNTGLATLLIFSLLILLMISGLPLVFGLSSLAIIFLYLIMGPLALNMLANRTWDVIDTPIIVCLPMFVFMGVMLEKSGVAAKLYDMMLKWAGGLRGGLAAGTVGICMIMAAMTGLSAAATLTMGLTALPEMLRRGYQKNIALGCIAAGGALGILIPPSVSMVMYAIVAQSSVGQLFMGGVIPGVLLGSVFILYILIRCWLQPNLGPSLPPDERATWAEKGKSLRNVLLPILIIAMVLGSIYMGLATPTEASAVGALGTVISAAVYRQFNLKNLKETCFATARVCGLAMWMLIGTYALKSLMFVLGTDTYVEEIFLKLPGGTWGALVTMQLIWFIMGCLVDPLAILMITGPIFCPIIAHAGMSLVWFGIVFVVNMEMAYLTPPFGMNLFYLKGVAPKSVTINDIYKSIWPFVACQAFVLALVIVFPALALWLPSHMIQ